MNPLPLDHFWHRNSWQPKWNQLVTDPVYAVAIQILTERIHRATVPANSGIETNALFNAFRDGQFEILNALEDLALPPRLPVPLPGKPFLKPRNAAENPEDQQTP